MMSFTATITVYTVNLHLLLSYIFSLFSTLKINVTADAVTRKDIHYQLIYDVIFLLFRNFLVF
jgi:hypothetical protein